jgi:hypothetical protein
MPNVLLSRAGLGQDALARIASGFSSAINTVPVNPNKSANVPIGRVVFIECFFSSQDHIVVLIG